MKTIIVFFGLLGCIFCTALVTTHVRTGPDHCRDVYNQAVQNFDSGR
uniref:Uncharacterized protein n=1 Tax=Rhodnius prolixus TaxID=13249 RepID=T1I8T3_RHOPR